MPLPNTSRELPVASGSGSNGMAAPHRNSAAPLPNGIQASHHPSRDQPAHPSSQPSFLQGQGSLPHIIQQILQIGHSSTVQAAQMSGLGLGGPTTSARASGPFATSALSKLDKETEACWLQAGRTAESLGNWNKALACYETALRHSPYNQEALTQTAGILRQQEKFPEAIEFFTRVVAHNDGAGDVWGALGHCFLMMDDTSKAYACYQQAIAKLPHSKGEPKLWYGIGILYDRHNSLNMAEEAFVNVINHDPNFEKANEIYFRLGIIYKQKRNSAAALNCFRYILSNPPRPLCEPDIWFQIGQVFDQQQDFVTAKKIYDTLLTTDANHAKVLRELGGIFARQDGPFFDLDKSCDALTKSLEEDANDPFAWYLLGRSYMAGAQYGKAYEAYQQAVYRDGRNPAFWCSIGVLYYKINQYHDSLDAYSRAIRTNPYLAEVWHNLGALYESCNDQLIDAVDAYRRAISLDENNEAVRRRLEQIDFHRHARGQPLSPPPKPIDISPLSESWNAANGSASFTGPQSASTPGGTSQPFNPAFPNGLPESSQPTAVSMPVNNLTTSNGGRRSIGDATAPPSRPGPEHFPAPTNGAASSRAPPARDYAASYSLAGGNARPLSRSEMPSRSAAGWNGPPPASIAPASSLPPNRSGRMGHSPPISPHQGRNDYTMNPPHRPVPDEGERGRPAMGYRDQHSMSNYAGPTLVDRRPNTSPVPNGNAIPPAVAERERQLQQQQQQAGVRRRSSFQSRGMSPPTHNGPPTATGAAPALAAIRGPIKEKRPASTQPPGKPRNVIIPPVPRSDASNRPSPAPTSSHSADTQMRPRDAEESYDQEEGADSLIALASGASGGSSNRSNGAGPRQGSEPLPRPIPVAPVPRKRSAGELGHPPARVSSTSPVDDQAGTNSKRPKLGNGPVWANSGGGSTTSVGPSPSTPQAPVSQIDGLSRSSPAVQTAVVEAPLSRGPSPTNSLPAQPTSGTEAKAGEEVASQE